MARPLTITNLETLISKGESLTLEFKKSTGELKEICQSACGMLNAVGGKILVGVSNSGEMLGQGIAEDTLRKIQLEFQKIEPSYNPELTLVNLTENKKIIEKMHASSRWENQISNKSIADLDHHEIILTLEEAIRIGRLNDPKTRDIVAILQGFGLLQKDKLMNAAVALFIKEDKALPEYTNLCLKMARFKGNNKNEFTDSKTFYGNAFSIYKQAQNFLIQHLPIAGKFIPGVFERQDEPLYPMSALREAIANAICHREYGEGGSNVSIAIFDDRLEIGSTGGLHFGLTIGDLFRDHASKLWNPLIAEIFYKRGVIEAWGRGTLRIKEDIEQAGLVSPHYKIITGSLILVLSPERQVHSGSVSVELNERQKFIANIFYNNPNDAFSFRDLRELAKNQNINDRILKEDLHNLKKNFHLLEVIGKGAGARWSLKKIK